MAQKNNIRSIRFSDELAELIDRQVGKTFTEKFENLITRCVWELPKKETELQRLDKEIKKKKAQLQKMSIQVQNLTKTMDNVKGKLIWLEKVIESETEIWKA